MFIGYLKLNIFIPHSRSLKDRRRVLESLRQRVRNNFNISVAQKSNDSWKNCELFFVTTHYQKNYAHDVMEKVENFVRELGGVHILEAEKGII